MVFWQLPQTLGFSCMVTYTELNLKAWSWWWWGKAQLVWASHSQQDPVLMTLAWCAVYSVLSCLWWEPKESVCRAEPPGLRVLGEILRASPWEILKRCYLRFCLVFRLYQFLPFSDDSWKFSSWVQVLHLILTNICASTYLFEKWKRRLDLPLCVSGSCSCLSPFEYPVWWVWSWVIFLCCWWSNAPVQQTLKEKLNQRKHKEELKPIKIPVVGVLVLSVFSVENIGI